MEKEAYSREESFVDGLRTTVAFPEPRKPQKSGGTEELKSQPAVCFYILRSKTAGKHKTCYSHQLCTLSSLSLYVTCWVSGGKVMDSPFLNAHIQHKTLLLRAAWEICVGSFHFVLPEKPLQKISPACRTQHHLSSNPGKVTTSHL